MKNINEFCKDHKKEIVVTGLIIGGVVISALITKRIFTKNLIDLTGKDVISWTPNDKFMNLERVKEILDLNADNTSKFAIFREGLEPNQYAVILLDDNVIVSK